MKAWLDGEISGISVRNELDRLRDVLDAAARDGHDTRPLWHALAGADSVAAAELALGPRAPATPVLVRAALDIAESLEEVVSPSGLYPRLAELAPDVGAEILTVAAARHAPASWLSRLWRFEAVGGTAQLAHAGTRLPEVCAALAVGGAHEALIDHAAQTGALEPVVALLRAGSVEASTRAAASALDANPAAPLVPWLAAVHGPLLDALLIEVVPHLTTDTARRALALASTDFPGTRVLLEQ